METRDQCHILARCVTKATAVKSNTAYFKRWSIFVSENDTQRKCNDILKKHIVQLPDLFTLFIFYISILFISLCDAVGIGLLQVLEYWSTTPVVNYSSNFFTTRVLVNLYFWLQISISGCSFFAVETVGIYGNLGLHDFICNLPACALIKYEVKKSHLFKALTL